MCSLLYSVPQKRLDAKSPECVLLSGGIWPEVGCKSPQRLAEISKCGES
jgi:hypothetical protein